jgi:hypothetical protein
MYHWHVYGDGRSSLGWYQAYTTMLQVRSSPSHPDTVQKMPLEAPRKRVWSCPQDNVQYKEANKRPTYICIASLLMGGEVLRNLT